MSSFEKASALSKQKRPKWSKLGKIVDICSVPLFYIFILYVLYNSLNNPQQISDSTVVDMYCQIMMISGYILTMIMILYNDRRFKLWNSFRTNHAFRDHQTWKVTKESITLITDNLVLVNKLSDIPNFVQTDGGFVWRSYGNSSEYSSTLPISAFENAKQYQYFQELTNSTY